MCALKELKKTIGKPKICAPVISEVQGNMNNHPLTYLNEENVNELFMLYRSIYGRSLNPVNRNDLVEISENEMNIMDTFTKNLLNQFMGKFEHEHLLALKQHHSYNRNDKSSNCYLKNSDAVIDKDAAVERLLLNADVMLCYVMTTVLWRVSQLSRTFTIM